MLWKDRVVLDEPEINLLFLYVLNTMKNYTNMETKVIGGRYRE
jgi:hypothetical protein